LEKNKDEMCECLKIYLTLCLPNTELKISADLLKMEVENLKQGYEDMVIEVSLNFRCIYACNNVVRHLYNVCTMYIAMYTHNIMQVRN